MTKQPEDTPAVKGLINIDSRLGSQTIREDGSTTRKRYRRYYSTILSSANTQLNEIKGFGLTPYHHEYAKNSYKWFDQAYKKVCNIEDRF